MWRVARSLEVLRNQVNAAYPGRRKEHDGTIGDAAHQPQMSDHNPWVKDGAAGVVTALDITHDPAHGVDTYAIAETLRRNRDHRIKYIISNRRIFSSQLHAWEWHPYTGANPHDRHVHISVLPDKALYDDRTPWNLHRAPASEAAARPEKPNFVGQEIVRGSSYDQCLERVLAHEGGYTNDPRDPGGPTNFGISIYDYRKYLKPGATADVKRMSLAEAQRIYRSKYWDALCCDDLPAGVDYTVFDYGVNSGIGRAGKVVRRVLGLSDADWRVNADVIAALKKSEPGKVIIAINDERLTFLKSLRTWRTFGVGWGRRIVEVKAFSLELARYSATKSSGNGPPALTVLALAPASGKGYVGNLRQLFTAVGAGAAVLASGGVLAHVAAGIEVWVALMLVALGIAVVGLFAWLVHARHHATQDAPGSDIVPVTVTSTAAMLG
ncbi:MAG: glycoside hydrolase family 108 protein [Xanthobacteraceae bacterium]|nr:glycoside hydrolase family 108 protein [Xanthobacteraceae bacterium]